MGGEGGKEGGEWRGGRGGKGWREGTRRKGKGRLG